MGRKRSKKHYSKAERAILREKAERDPMYDRRQRGACYCKPKTSQVTTPANSPASSRSLDTYLKALNGRCTATQLKRFVLLFETVSACRPGLIDKPYDNGLIRLACVPWERDLATWRPRGRGLATAFRSLAAHLLGRYPISPHLWDALLTKGAKYGDDRIARFVRHVARGCSPRSLVGTELLPTPLTRRMLHVLVNPPQTMPYVEMVRRAQVVGHGGCPSLVPALLGSSLGFFRSNEACWDPVIQWFCRQPDLTPEQVGPVCDFLDQKISDGDPLDLSGRTTASMMRRVGAWHKQTAALHAFRRRYFEPSGFVNMRWTLSVRTGATVTPRETWTMEEILDAKALVAEGGTMRHCVSTYADTIAYGNRSIWSLRCDNTRRLTTEVRNRIRTVHQVRGKANRLPKMHEVKYIEAWARRNDLRMDSYEVRRMRGG